MLTITCYMPANSCIYSSMEEVNGNIQVEEGVRGLAVSTLSILSFLPPFLLPSLSPILSYPILSYPILSYPILSYPILSYPILSYPILSYPILSYPILSYPILSYPILSYPILSYPILSYPILSFPFLSFSSSSFPILIFHQGAREASFLVNQILKQTLRKIGLWCQKNRVKG